MATSSAAWPRPDGARWFSSRTHASEMPSSSMLARKSAPCPTGTAITGGKPSGGSFHTTVTASLPASSAEVKKKPSQSSNDKSGITAISWRTTLNCSSSSRRLRSSKVATATSSWVGFGTRSSCKSACSMALSCARAMTALRRVTYSWIKSTGSRSRVAVVAGPEAGLFCHGFHG
ncbi:hypothetical protein D3C72_1564420 [compost metagenome]